MEYDEQSDEPIISPDTENATHFHTSEAPPELHAKFKRFHGYNTGVYNGHWADNKELRRLDNLALYDAISSQLELTNHQKRTGRQLFDALDLKDIGGGAALISFCVCALVCRDDGRIYHPYRNDRNNDDLFVKFGNELGFRRKIVAACYNRVSDALN
ncbi:hypothetical protein [Natronorubrum bangense]|uniref:Uncharacterized protein n=2 Tax=Natronorubrum bangense TaxID=61858 RepID=L9WK86_9EURY|nr:hypothetical protein [Natronorubrum bangense]ELY49864.1 hypothetical protein C494_07635 [Natronorubrum bangense JCM 10635]QCC55483.1 hypothetical protein DV706_14005 [Natronorubrum bangense]